MINIKSTGCVFMIYLDVLLHTSSSKQETKSRFRSTAMLFFTLLGNTKIAEASYFFQRSYPSKFHNLMLKGPRWTPASKVSTVSCW